jgi:protein-L-isoaspartate(D-aspartate) O-methyltransferase
MSKKKLLESLKQKDFSQEIIDAFSKVKREDFVEGNLKNFAYRDRPLPIGENATISHPYTIAFMLDLLELRDDLKVLEIGSGCGYVLALMSKINKNGELYGVEINNDLAIKSKEYLSDENITVVNKNGYDGLREYGPYDRIIVSAAYSKEPKHLLNQLNEGGILISPVDHSIIKYIKNKEEITKESHFGLSFVSMR